MKQTDKVMLDLSSLRNNLKTLMDPKLLEKLAELLDALGTENSAYIERYRFFVEKNGYECRYAAMAKEFFLNDNAEACAKAINELYHSWSKNYEK